MDLGLLTKFFGSSTWHGPCTVILDADASVTAPGPDSVGGGGVKTYSPRIITGRMIADAVCLLPERQSLLLVQQHRTKQTTGEESVRHTLIVVDTTHIAGLEFTDLTKLAELGIAPPNIDFRGEFRPGSLVG